MNGRVTSSVKKSDIQRENLDNQTRKADHARYTNSQIDRILYRHRTVGDQAVSKLIRSGAQQAKLRIGQPSEIYE